MPCGFTSAWVSWIQIENFSAWHNLPIGTKANGLGGPDAVLEFNNPTVVRHIANLAEAQKDKSFDYGGRTTEPEGKFISRRLRHDRRTRRASTARSRAAPSSRSA